MRNRPLVFTPKTEGGMVTGVAFDYFEAAAKKMNFEPVFIRYGGDSFSMVS